MEELVRQFLEAKATKVATFSLARCDSRRCRLEPRASEALLDSRGQASDHADVGGVLTSEACDRPTHERR